MGAWISLDTLYVHETLLLQGPEMTNPCCKVWLDGAKARPVDDRHDKPLGCTLVSSITVLARHSFLADWQDNLLPAIAHMGLPQPVVRCSLDCLLAVASEPYPGGSSCQMGPAFQQQAHQKHHCHLQ